MLDHKQSYLNSSGGRQGYKVYVDGSLMPQEEAKVSALDRGFALGDGVFETMLVRRERVFRLGSHLTRLRRSAAAIRLPLPWQDHELAEALDSTIVTNGISEAVLRLTVSRGVPEKRGLLPSDPSHPSLVIQPSPFVPPSSRQYEQGFRAIVASLRRNEHSPTAFIKSCNYLDNVLARLEAADAGADEAVMLNTAGNVACGSSSNIFLIVNGEIVTPTIDSGVLAGITRAAVSDVAAHMGLSVSERVVSLHDLLSSEECFLTNTVLGLMPVVELSGSRIRDGYPGPLTRKLRAGYEDLVEGER